MGGLEERQPDQGDRSPGGDGVGGRPRPALLHRFVAQRHPADHHRWRRLLVLTGGRRSAGAGPGPGRPGTLRNVSHRPPPREMRASDADRDGVISLLSAAAADGRLSMSEHAERIERAYSARTLGDLAVLTSDLAAPCAHCSTATAGTAAGWYRRPSR